MKLTERQPPPIVFDCDRCGEHIEREVRGNGFWAPPKGWAMVMVYRDDEGNHDFYHLCAACRVQVAA